MSSARVRSRFALTAIASVLVAACAVGQSASPTPARQVLRLATTTSTQDSGLLDAILPDFERTFDARVDVVAVGTGQALEIGSRGDADVVLVHARSKEDMFIAKGDGINRQDVMYNDFVIVGPAADPAGVRGVALAKDAFARIAQAKAPFASRGDESGTHTKEKAIWASAAVTPTSEGGWYYSLGQGMGETLGFANEKLAYTLTDRGTWLAQRDKLPDLEVLLGGEDIAHNLEKILLNPYGVIQVNPAKHPGVNAALAAHFVEWITSLKVQQLIDDFDQDQYHQPLFYPNSAQWKAAQP